MLFRISKMMMVVLCGLAAPADQRLCRWNLSVTNRIADSVSSLEFFGPGMCEIPALHTLFVGAGLVLSLLCGESGIAVLVLAAGLLGMWVIVEALTAAAHPPLLPDKEEVGHWLCCSTLFALSVCFHSLNLHTVNVGVNGGSVQP